MNSVRPPVACRSARGALPLAPSDSCHRAATDNAVDLQPGRALEASHPGVGLPAEDPVYWAWGVPAAEKVTLEDPHGFASAAPPT